MAEKLDQRRLKRPKYRSFRLSKRIKHPKPPVLGSFRLMRKSVLVLFRNWKLFLGIFLIYLFLTLFLVRGFNVNQNTGSIKDLVDQLLNANTGKVLSGLAIFVTLIANAGSTQSETASGFMFIFMLVTTLVIIWGLRQSVAGTKVRVRDAFYKGVYPLVQFVLVLLTVIFQMIPMVIANYLFKAVFTNGVASTLVEQLLWGVLLGLLVLWSLYMMTSSIIALYVVTLPDMTPMKALRTAGGLVRYRRWTIMRKILFLPIALLLILAIFVLPAILLWPIAANWIFFVVSLLLLFVVHSYMYHLYRELIA